MNVKNNLQREARKKVNSGLKGLEKEVPTRIRETVTNILIYIDKETDLGNYFENLCT